MVSLPCSDMAQRAMPTARLFPGFALLAWVAASGAPLMAQTPNAPSPELVKIPTTSEILFYVAHGDADVCGLGCSEWVAADGKIDAGAAQRFRSFLAKLGRRRPPMFLHSPGGAVGASIELGRLIHDQKFTVSVGHTVPHGCDRDKPLEKSCEALKRSGKELESDFDPNLAMCNSGCVYVLAAAATRLVPPWVRLGIHDVGIDPDRKGVSAAALAEGKRTAHARLQEFSRDMGIDKALLTAAFAVPFDTAKMIDRDEIARFGIDRRDFGEDVWRLAPLTTPTISKRFFFSGEQRHYRNAELRFDCGPSLRVMLGLNHDSSDQTSAGLPPVGIDVNGTHIDLRAPIRSPKFDIGGSFVDADKFDSLTDEAIITVTGADGQAGSAGDIVLRMDGFAALFAKLRKSCEASARSFINPFEATYLGRKTDLSSSPFGPAGFKMIGPFPSPLPFAPAGGAQKDPQTRPAASIPPLRPLSSEVSRTVAAEEKRRLDAIRADCTLGPHTLGILQYPQHGALTVENYEAGVCAPEGLLIFYEPDSGYVGADSITIDIESENGVISTRHYVINVAEPASPAPASEAAH